MRSPLDRPNLILINCDDLGYGDLACYGSLFNRTPAIDRLAAEGVRFTDFYMASPVCSPSRGAMLTGCYPLRIGFGNFDGRWVLFPGQGLGLDPAEITLATLLKRQGYATKHVGKWHCGDQPEFLPTRHGFDSYYGLPYSNDMGRQAGRRTQWPPLPLMCDEQVIEQQPDQSSLTERYVEQSLAFLRAHRDNPFFLYLAHMHVHLPHYPPRRFLKTAVNGPYGAAVECIDWSVAVLLHELRQLGLDNNTLVIFTSDNGSRGDRGGSNFPLRGAKGTCWEGGQRVPCLMRWPGVIPAGTTCSEVVTGMDFLPTFAPLGGASVPTDRILDGRDVFPLCAATPHCSPHDAFFYYLCDDLQAVRAGRWKLHVSRNHRPVRELYDLQADVGEATNLYEQQPEVVKQLLSKVDACRDDLGDAATSAPGRNCRPLGRVTDRKPLTVFDETHPYIEAMHDLPDVG